MIKGKDKERHSSDKHIQEEKRVLYVAMSRAQNRLFVLAPKKYGDVDKKVSTFLTGIRYDKNPTIIKAYDYKGEGLLQDTPTGFLERKKKEKQKAASIAIDQMSITTVAHKLIELARIKYFEEHKKDDPQCKNFDPMKVFDIDLSQVSLDEDLGGKVTPMFNADNLTLSTGSLDSYITCPFQFKLDRMRVPGPNKIYFDLGTSVHDTIQKISENKIAGKTTSADEVKKILDEKWIFRTFGSGQQESTFKSSAQEMVEKYVEMEAKNQNEIVAVEEDFAIKRKNVVINGRIDKIEKNDNGEYELVDYKTGKTVKKEVDLVSDVQLNVYAAAMKENPKFGKLPVKATLMYLRKEPVSITISEMNVNSVLDVVDEAIDDILEGKFEAKPSGSNCRNCAYKNMCEFAV